MRIVPGEISEAALIKHRHAHTLSTNSEPSRHVVYKVYLERPQVAKINPLIFQSLCQTDMGGRRSAQ